MSANKHYLNQLRDTKGRWTEEPAGPNADREADVASFEDAPPEGYATRRGYALAAAKAEVSATTMASGRDARSTDGIADWWGEHFMSAAYASDSGKQIPVMDDDWRPSGQDRKTGRALSGNRRVHRMKYEGAGVALRMPSATMIKAYARENDGGAFDVPVEVTNTHTGATITAHVRLTQNGPGSWTAMGLGFKDGRDQAVVSEAVASVLEARHPRSALVSCGDLHKKFAERKRAEGASPRRVNSSWIGAVSYDRANGVSFMMTKDGRVYGKRVTESMHNSAYATRDRGPGEGWNKFMRKAESVAAARCDTCGRVYVADIGHVCTGWQRSRRTASPNQAARSAGLDYARDYWRKARAKQAQYEAANK